MTSKLAYILAASHSGSTLLSMLLGSHPRIVTTGEINLSAQAIGSLDRYRCSCGELILKCVFWQKVKEGMSVRGHVFDLSDAGTDFKASDSVYARRLLNPMVRGPWLEGLRDAALSLSPIWRRQCRQIQDRNAAFVSTALDVTGAGVVVDSSKIALRLKYLLRNAELDIKVIRLIRDGRAVALTYMDPAGFADAQDPGRRAGGMGGNRKNQRLPMEQAAYEWKRCIEEAEQVLRNLSPSQWIEVRYEAYCSQPDETLSRICAFLNIDPEMLPNSFRNVEQHVVGNGMRLDTTSEIQLDERWQSTLSNQDLAEFDRIAGAVNQRYGYK